MQFRMQFSTPINHIDIERKLGGLPTGVLPQCANLDKEQRAGESHSNPNPTWIREMGNAYQIGIGAR